MVQLLQARDITLEDLYEQFGLAQSSAEDFFPEWRSPLSVSPDEQRSLQRLKQNYFNLTRSRPLMETAVKMVVLSPLLDLAGFYSAPFSIRTEVGVEVTAVDEGVTVRGSIDVLVV